MEALTLEEIASMCGGTLSGQQMRTSARRISKDTRTLLPGDLYLALRGEHFDGNQFVSDAVSKGAVGAILDDPAAVSGLPGGFPVILVSEGGAALHRLAASWRDRLSATIVCITGSSGKTSTKDFTAAVLGVRFRTSKTSGNFNNAIGLPLSMLSASVTDGAAVWEIGMNHPGEVAPLTALARPSVAIVTNIGVAHIEHLGSREAIAREKAALLAGLPSDGTAIFPDGDDFSEFLASMARGKRVRTGGPSCGIRAEEVSVGLEETVFTLLADGRKCRARLPMPGVHMVSNALLAVAAGLACGVSVEECAEGLSTAPVSSGRLTHRVIRGVVFLDDTYNANPDSMIAALEVLSSLPSQGRKIAVLGPMGELGDHAEEGYRRVGAAASMAADLVVTTGPETAPMAEAASSGSAKIQSVSDGDAACHLLRSLTAPGDLVLVKGSRSAHMETVLAKF